MSEQDIIQGVRLRIGSHSRHLGDVKLHQHYRASVKNGNQYILVKIKPNCFNMFSLYSSVKSLEGRLKKAKVCIIRSLKAAPILKTKRV